MADVIGVKKNSVQKYENGTVKNLKIDTIRKICLYFEIPPWLIIFPEYMGTSTVNEVIDIHKNIEVISENRDILLLHLNLNNKGKEKALNYLKDLNKIQDYNK